MGFKVSVITPVYNAAQYVTQAVESAVALEEVGEVILIEDNSPDNALEVCRYLEKTYDKVKLFTHPNRENRGAGASRNLGIEKASFEYIAFLDADDYYLPNRFTTDKKCFEDQNIEGCYNAAAYLIDDDYAFNTVKSRYKCKDPRSYLYSIKENINFSDLFFYMLNGGKGHFCTNAITVRRSVFDKVGVFNRLGLHQDNHMWLRIALECRLTASEISRPTNMIRVHKENRIRNVSSKSRIAYYDTLYHDLSLKVKTKRDYSTLVKKKIAARTYHFKSKPKRLLMIMYEFALHFAAHPKDVMKVGLRHFKGTELD